MMEIISQRSIGLACARIRFVASLGIALMGWGLMASAGEWVAAQDSPPVLDPLPENPLRLEEIPTPLPSGLSPKELPIDGDGDPQVGSILRGTNLDSEGIDPNEIDPRLFHSDSLSGAEMYANSGPIIPGGPPSPTRELLPPPPPGGRTIRLNPLAVPQGIAHLAFSEAEPLSGKRLGFPFSLVPDRFYGHVPRLKVDLGLPDARSHSKGGPLETGSWRNRPWHVDAFAGGYFPGSVIRDFDRPEGTTIVGGRIGLDMGHYLGSELRFGIGEANLPTIQDTLKFRISDLSWQYYPWGDTQLRPYTSVGIGFTNYEYSDAFNIGHGATVLSMPVSIGIKHRMKQWLSFRLEFQDNITFGTSQFSSANNWALTGTLEFRFGGRRRTYYPFNPGRSGLF